MPCVFGKGLLICRYVSCAGDCTQNNIEKEEWRWLKITINLLTVLHSGRDKKTNERKRLKEWETKIEKKVSIENEH